MRDKNVRVNSLADNATLKAMFEAYRPYVELKRKERQLILSLRRQKKQERLVAELQQLSRQEVMA